MHPCLKTALGFAALAVPAARAAEPVAAPPSVADANARVPEPKYDSALT